MGDELEPGTVLREKYRVERVLGRGGMGCVLAAWHLHLDKRVAIKVLRSELRAHPELVERFLREARAASRLDGDHVARILDVDRLPDGTPFMVMEHLDGHDLSTVRRNKSPCAIRAAVEYVIQACDALAQAHERGIVHRDIKPANLFVASSPDGRQIVKVLDFGISKMSSSTGASEPSMTQTSAVMGSAEYMSPEQMLSARDVDGRTDVWALGVVLFEILTATPPFVGETLPQVCALVLSQAPPRLRALRPDVPDALEAVVLRCLEKDREKRFATARDLSLALQSCLSTTNVGLGPPSLVASTASAPSPVVPAPPVFATLAIPTTPVPTGTPAPIVASPPTGPTTSEGTSISVAPSAPSTPPTADPPAPALRDAHPVDSPFAAPEALPLAAATSSVSTGVASSTSTPYSRDLAEPPARRWGGRVVAAILAVAVALSAVAVFKRFLGTPKAPPSQPATAASALSEAASASATPASRSAEPPVAHSFAGVPADASAPSSSADPPTASSPSTVAARPSTDPRPLPKSTAPVRPTPPTAQPIVTSGID